MESGLSRAHDAFAAVAAEDTPPALTLAQIAGRGAAQRLYADVVASVLSFLPLRDAAAAALTCRQWLGHAAKEPSRSLALHILWDSRLLALLAPGGHNGSPPRASSVPGGTALRRHVASCRTGFPPYRAKDEQIQALQPTVPPLLAGLSRFSQLQRLFLQLPQIPHTGSDGSVQPPLAYDLSPLLALEQLRTLELGGLEFTIPQRLPPSLRHLRVEVRSPVPLHAQHLADAIGQLPLLEHLELRQQQLLCPCDAQGAEHSHPRWDEWLQLAHLHTVLLV